MASKTKKTTKEHRGQKQKAEGKRDMYNWEELKAQFMASDYWAVHPFLKEKGISYYPKSREETSTWVEEKKAAWADANAEAQEELRIKLTDTMRTVKTDIMTAYPLAFGALMAFLRGVDPDNESGEGVVTPRDFKHVWEVLRTEAGLPTNITKSQITDGDVPLSPEEMEEMGELLGEAFNNLSNARKKLKRDGTQASK